MPSDKSLFYYGHLYNRLFDPALAEARRVATSLVAEGSSVLDIGCGTGQLCFALRAEKNCRVVGVDLSLRMLRFAERANRYDDVAFAHLDATDLVGIEDRSFDYATVLFLMHEIPREMQLRVLSEALRFASHVLIVDSNVPLPVNPSGLGIRIVEATFGREHYGHFKDFLAGGGIGEMLDASGSKVTVAHRSSFWRNCREVVAISRAQ
jgi:ubiquinone/menaquinone biosynthesis C-methylase UbiE